MSRLQPRFDDFQEPPLQKRPTYINDNNINTIASLFIRDNEELQQRLYNKYEKLNIDGLNITLMGDLKNGRTIHSLVKVLRLFNVHITLISPPSLKLPTEYLRPTDCEATQFEPYASTTDVLYVTRVQKERGSKEDYKLSLSELNQLPNTAIVLHPLPRRKELPIAFDSDPRAKYFQQIKNGLLVRKALLRQFLEND